jgi:hypothetical protein
MPYSNGKSHVVQKSWPSKDGPGEHFRHLSPYPSSNYPRRLGEIASVDGPTGGAVPAQSFKGLQGFGGIFDDLKATFSGTWGKLLLVAALAGGLIYASKQGWLGDEE